MLVNFAMYPILLQVGALMAPELMIYLLQHFYVGTHGEIDTLEVLTLKKNTRSELDTHSKLSLIFVQNDEKQTLCLSFLIFKVF